MSIQIIISICGLLLIGYLFDLTSSRTRIPSVIMLLVLGWTVKQLSVSLKIGIPDLSFFLPILGTVGLILIVLEGALELELNRSHVHLAKKSFVMALAPMMITAFVISLAFYHYGTYPFRTSLINAIPFCVISSAIAIPSTTGFLKADRQFVIYESSLSDIIGVLFFDFVALNEYVDFTTVADYLVKVVIMLAVAFLATVALAVIMREIDHPIKHGPIMILLVLIYAVSKSQHLPALIFVLIFGLFLGNLDELRRFDWIKKLRPEDFDHEIHQFKQVSQEAVFVVKTLFFLLFGFLIETSDIINGNTIMWALAITVLIYLVRASFLKLNGLPLFPMLFIAPRGLITILLFFSILAEHKIAFANKALTIQVIIMTSFIMMTGMIISKKQTMSDPQEPD